MEHYKVKNNQIQKEQLQLVKIQSELEGILGKVSETINALKVEELQLKSSAVAAMNIKPMPPCDADELPSTSASALLAAAKTTLPAKQEQFESSVNKQEIDLNMFLPVKRGYVEEEDEDDD